MKNYDFYVQKMIDLLKKKQFCIQSMDSHTKCYQIYREYLVTNGLPYCNDSVKCWLETIRTIKNRHIYYAYWNYMNQLEELESNGTVRAENLSLVTSFYDKLDSTLKTELDEYLDSCRYHYSIRSFELTRIYCSRILLHFSESGIATISNITYDDIDSFYSMEFHCSSDTRYIYLSHARKMFSFFADCGKCSHGFAIIIDDRIYPKVGTLDMFSDEHQKRINELQCESLEFPADEFLISIGDAVSELASKGYASTPLHVARHVLTLLYIFLDRNGLGYLPEISWIWFDEIKEKIGSWKAWRRVLKMYEQYVTDGAISVGNRYTYITERLEGYPDWCRVQIMKFQECMIREFRAENTADKYKYGCMRFCTFLLGHDVSSFDGITPELLIEFSLTDEHETFKGRSSYFTVIRRFLCYLEDQNIINNPYLHTLLSPGIAQSTEIVDVLTKGDETAVIEYRSTHTKPIELRNAAMVMAGLRLGLRASDVVNLKLSDIDWKNKTVSIIQQKTRASITLPLANDVGNTIYAYIKNGRPCTNTPYVFSCHRAPYGKVTTKICNNALYAILPDRMAVHHKGFHVTRRTFATNILRNNSGINAVMDSLGHRDSTSVMKYLSFDDERMMECPLSLFECRIELRGGLE